MAAFSLSKHLLSAAAALAVLLDGALAFAQETVPHATETMETVGEHAEAVGEHVSKGGLPQFEISTWPSQIFWLFVTFVVLYTFFSKKALPEVSGVVDGRQARIAADLETAGRLNRDAETTRQSYEETLGHARTQAAQVSAAATAEIKASIDASLKKFQEKSAAEIASLEKRIATDAGKAMTGMEDAAAQLAHDIVSRLFGVKADIAHAQTVVQSLNKREAA